MTQGSILLAIAGYEYLRDDLGKALGCEVARLRSLGVPATFVLKRRLSGEKTEVMGVSAQVKGKPVIIDDDMIRSGSSLLNAARAYVDAGVTSVAAVASHGEFVDGAIERIVASGLLRKIICTDSHPRAREIHHPILTVQSVAPVFLPFVRSGS